MYIGKIACIDSAMNNTRTLLPTRCSARYEDTASKRNPTCTFSVRVCVWPDYIHSLVCERREEPSCLRAIATVQRTFGRYDDEDIVGLEYHRLALADLDVVDEGSVRAIGSRSTAVSISR